MLASFARFGIEAIGVLREAGVAADAHVWLCRSRHKCYKEMSDS